MYGVLLVPIYSLAYNKIHIQSVYSTIKSSEDEL